MQLRTLLQNCHLSVDLGNSLASHRQLRALDFGHLSELAYLSDRLPKTFKPANSPGCAPGKYHLVHAIDECGYQGFSCIRVTAKGKNSFHLDVLFCHRGTDELFDVVETWPDIAFFNMLDPTYAYQGMSLVEKTVKLLGCGRKNLRILSTATQITLQFVHVGHSLGGVLAQVTADTYDHFWVGFETPHLPWRKKNRHPAGVKTSAHNMMGSLASTSKWYIQQERLGWSVDKKTKGKLNIVDLHSMKRILEEQFDHGTGDWIDADTYQHEMDHKRWQKEQTMLFNERIRQHATLPRHLITASRYTRK